MSGRVAVSRRTALKVFLTTGIGAVAGGAAYGFLYARDALQLSTVTVPIEALPPALSGLRIGLMTDIHRSRWVTDEDVVAAVGLLMSARPDLVVLGGDYVTWGDRRYVEPSARALGGLTAPHGVFAILGNHDDDHDMAAALSRARIQVLRDARTHLEINGEGLDVAGIRFWTRRPSDIGNVVRGAKSPVVLLAHDPRRLSEAAALNIPLVLSGHTHGGQVVLPGVGAVAARKFPVVSGLARKDKTTMFVSRGVGTVYVPVRLNCPPEVVVVTLESANLPRNV
jgi:predicted MPP superfamily phosphohydrolase